MRDLGRIRGIARFYEKKTNKQTKQNTVALAISYRLD